MSYYEANEEKTGLRMTWNIFPSSMESAASAQVPQSCLLTPLKKNVQMMPVQAEPLRGKNGAVFNCFSDVNLNTKTWGDPFTGTRVAFPQNYADWISETNRPPETLTHVTEYTLPIQQTGQADPPCFLFVVDLCLYAEEMESLKVCLAKMISLIPQESQIGFITFGTNVLVHELGYTSCNKVLVLKGSGKNNEPVTAETIVNQLGLRKADLMNAQNPELGGGSKFFVPISQCMTKIEDILADLQPDEWPKETDCRPRRCTGMALHIALCLMESLKHQRMGRVMLFTGGVCTHGPGATAYLKLGKNIRQHQDIIAGNENSYHVATATKFYENLAARAVQSGHAVDCFMASLDQTGFYEMKLLQERTGGYIVMGDTFSSHVLEGSIERVFPKDENGLLTHGYNAKISVHCSKDIKICGAIGPVASLEKSFYGAHSNSKDSQVSDNCVGEGRTCEWAAGSIDHRTTIGFYFDISATNGIPANTPQYIQFQILYWHASGRRKLRVITMGYSTENKEINNLGTGFDQEVAAVLLARLAANKCGNGEDSLDVLKWIDRKLIRLASRFGDYQKERPESFQFPQEFGLFPQYMFHLRRSPFLQTFNASPDESAFYRSILCRENASNSNIMIMPSLMLYRCTGEEPEPVNLDINALRTNVTLLLDTFFHVVVWFGETVGAWMDQNYHEMPEYEHFARSINGPRIDAKGIIESDMRFPVPKYVQCRAGGSQARFLLAKVNPSATHQSRGDGMMGGVDSGAGAVVLTDDVSIETFVEHLVKLAVSS